jgi:hypothetical protein
LDDEINLLTNVKTQLNINNNDDNLLNRKKNKNKLKTKEDLARIKQENVSKLNL